MSIFENQGKCVFCSGDLRWSGTQTSFSGGDSFTEYECNLCRSRERRIRHGAVQYVNSGHPLANQRRAKENGSYASPEGVQSFADSGLHGEN